MRLNKYIILICIYIPHLYSLNKIVYMVSPPRSLSTVFTSMMHHRGDFAIMHEPSQYAFTKEVYPTFAKTHFKPNALQSFDEVKRVILEKSCDQNLFVKEMSFAVAKFHLNDHTLMKMPNLQFVFLVRNPHHTIISMYKKTPGVEIDSLAQLIGYNDMLDLIKIVDLCGANKPYILYTEDLYSHPLETVQNFCKHIDIEFSPEHLHWNRLPENFDAFKEWNESKHQEYVDHWHGYAMMSTEFGKPAIYAVDAEGEPTFEEIENQESRNLCKKVYHEQLPYYEAIRDYQQR